MLFPYLPLSPPLPYPQTTPLFRAVYALFSSRLDLRFFLLFLV